MTTCPQCNAPVKPNYEFCKKCGTKLTSPLPTVLGSPRAVRVVAIGVGVIVCILLAAAAFFLTRKPFEELSEPVAGQAVPAAEAALPTTTAVPTATPTQQHDTPQGVVLEPGHRWKQDGLSLEVKDWDGDQQFTLVVHNETGQTLSLNEVPLRMAATSPEGIREDNGIEVYTPEVAGLVQPGASTEFRAALRVDKAQRAVWDELILVVEEFDDIQNAQWVLPIVNTPTATPTPGPTATSTATPTPHPTTVPGTNLRPDETWYEDGLALHLNLVSIDHDKLRIDLVLENLGDKTLTGYSAKPNYRMITNFGSVIRPPGYKSNDKFRSRSNFLVHGSFEIKPGERLVLASNGVFEFDFTDSAVTEVVVEVLDLSQIEIARWTIPVNE